MRREERFDMIVIYLLLVLLLLSLDIFNYIAYHFDWLKAVKHVALFELLFIKVLGRETFLVF